MLTNVLILMYTNVHFVWPKRYHSQSSKAISGFTSALISEHTDWTSISLNEGCCRLNNDTRSSPSVLIRIRWEPAVLVWNTSDQITRFMHKNTRSNVQCPEAMSPLVWSHEQGKRGRFANAEQHWLGDGEQVLGGVDLDLHVGVLQLHQTLPHLHLLAEGLQELLPQLVHLGLAVLAGVGLDLGCKRGGGRWWEGERES